jgi:hypothetical protein
LSYWSRRSHCSLLATPRALRFTCARANHKARLLIYPSASAPLWPLHTLSLPAARFADPAQELKLSRLGSLHAPRRQSRCARSLVRLLCRSRRAAPLACLQLRITRPLQAGSGTCQLNFVDTPTPSPHRNHVFDACVPVDPTHSVRSAIQHFSRKPFYPVGDRPLQPSHLGTVRSPPDVSARYIYPRPEPCPTTHVATTRVPVPYKRWTRNAAQSIPWFRTPSPAHLWLPA